MPTSWSKLLAEILDLPLQLFITALDHGHAALERLELAARFHVEHGNLTRLI